MRMVYKKFALTLCISLALAFFVGRNFIMSNGYAYFAENLEVYTIQHFFKVFYPTWNENLQIHNLADLPKLYLYAPLSFIAGILDSYKFLQTLLILLPYPIAFLSAFKLSEHITQRSVERRISERLLYLSSVSAAFIFTVNPWFTMVPLRIMFRFQYAFLPLLLYLFIKLLESKNLRFAIYFAGVMALVGGYRYSLIATLMVAIVFLSHVLLSKRGDWKEHISRLEWIFFAYFLFILLSMGKFLPSVLYSLYAPLQAVEQFTPTMVRRETLLHIFTTKIYESGGLRFDTTYNDMTHYLFISVLIFAFSYTLNKLPRKRKNYFYLTFPPLLYVIFVLLAAKEINVDSFLLSLPSSALLGRLLRHARWNIMPMIVSISIMAGLSTSLLLSKLKARLAYLVLAGILISASISAWPTFTGDMNGFWRPAEVPEDYTTVNNSYLAIEQDATHALWLPVFSTHKAIWVEASTPLEVGAPTGYFALRSSQLPTYDYGSFYFFDYYNPIGWRPYHRPLDGYTGVDWGDIFGRLNIKYLIIHNDVDWRTRVIDKGFTDEHIKAVAENLKSDRTLKVIYEGTYLTVFEIENANSQFEISHVALVYGGLPVHSTLAGLTKDISILYSDSNTFSEETIGHAEYVVLEFSEDALEQLFLALADRRVLLQPSYFVEREIEPATKWSYYPSVSDFNFQSNLKKMGISRWGWNFDYNKGLVSTWAPNRTMEIPFEIDESGDYKFFIRYLKNQNGGLINVQIDGRPARIDTMDPLNKFVWKDLGMHHLEEGEHKLVLENVEGFNTVNFLVLVPEEEYVEAERQTKQMLKEKTLVYVFEAESDFHSEGAYTTNIFGAEASRGRVLRLEGNKWTIMFDGENGYAEVLHNSSLNIANQFTISLWVKPYDSKSDQILVAKDDWSSVGRAVLPIGINDERYKVRIVDPRSKGNDQYDWSFVSPRHVVKEGVWQHIVFVVNTIAEPSVARLYINGELVKEETDETVGKIVGSLQTNELPLRIGSGFGRRFFNGEISEVQIYNSALSDGEIKELYKGTDPRQIAPLNLVLYFNPVAGDIKEGIIETIHDLSGKGNNGSLYEARLIFDRHSVGAWQDVEIAKDGIYRLAVHGKGGFNITIGGITRTLYMDELSLAYLNSIYLNMGTYRLEIVATEEFSYLDLVWLYSAQEENETLEDIFTPKEITAKITSYQKIDPTKYIVEVNATKPFMLSFAEAYDPLWIAHVKGEGIESIPLYSVINGFWINQTGQLEITIEYEPQKWFYYGSIISITTFLACLTYLTYNWTRNKAIWKQIRTILKRIHKRALI